MARGVAAGLRAWARGASDQEAGVELLIRSFGGRFSRRGCPWIKECEARGWFWVDVAQLVDHATAFSGVEQRVLTVVAALIDGRPVPDLAGVMAGLDRTELQLVLAALTHAAGEQVEISFEGDWFSLRRLPALVAWPEVA